jgi:hypothetical protein
MTLHEFLTAAESRYSPAQRMLQSICHSPGYHTRVPDGTPVHLTREAADYAMALLREGGTAHVARAHDVLDALLSLQNVDPTAQHYGIWSWFLEEPLDKMAPADWNWADFIGARLAQILVQCEERLSRAMAQRVRESLGHAAWSIFRRNIQPGYTNIAIMGAVVTMTAGELLDEPRLRDYGRRRLHNVARAFEFDGDFREYNSPTYTRVAIEEFDRGLLMVRDEAFRADAEALRQRAWEVIADHFHPATQQWAGPHSRAYSDHIRPGLARYLREQTGVDIQPSHVSADATNTSATTEGCDFVPPLPCPDRLRKRFTALPESPLLLVRRFINRQSPETDVVGTTWFDGDVCLASINHDTTWTQRRPLLGYWRTEQDPAIALRLRLLKDGRDFASGYLRQMQDGSRVLSALHFVKGKGDFHPNLGATPDGLFFGSDLRLRYELWGNGVQAASLGDQVHALSAGDWRAVIHAPEASFEDRSVSWTLCNDEGMAGVEAVLYAGEKRTFDLPQIRMIVACGVEVIRSDASPARAKISVTREGEQSFAATWPVDPALHVTAPQRAAFEPA